MTIATLNLSTLLPILPEIVLVVIAGLVMTLDLLWPESRRRSLGVLTAAGFALAIIVALVSVDSPGVGRKGEYYAIVIGAVIGMNFMAAAGDLIMLYLAIETTSIALYLLAGFLREDDKSAESGLKYFLFGSFTSTIML